jgi:hypothetical protein
VPLDCQDSHNFSAELINMDNPAILDYSIKNCAATGGDLNRTSVLVFHDCSRMIWPAL